MLCVTVLQYLYRGLAVTIAVPRAIAAHAVRARALPRLIGCGDKVAVGEGGLFLFQRRGNVCQDLHKHRVTGLCAIGCQGVGLTGINLNGRNKAARKGRVGVGVGVRVRFGEMSGCV